MALGTGAVLLPLLGARLVGGHQVAALATPVAPPTYPLVVDDVRQESPDAVSMRFAVPPELVDVFAFAPGQYVVVEVPLADGRVARRPYSIASGRADGELRIAVKRVDDGLVSPVLVESVRQRCPAGRPARRSLRRRSQPAAPSARAGHRGR